MQVSDELLSSRRRLEEIDGYQMLTDFEWLPKFKAWQLKFRIEINVESGHPNVPGQTDWYALIEEAYPWGAIRIYPAKVKGLTLTFPHQKHNYLPSEEEWNSGELCLSTNFGAFALRGFDNEPRRGDQKLYWHIQRCREWVYAASKNELVLPEHDFELPHFPLHSTTKYIYAEDAKSYLIWQSVVPKVGIAQLLDHTLGKSVFIKSFCDLKHKPLLDNQWSEAIDYPKVKCSNAIWVLLDFIPVTAPWQSPMTYGELYSIAKVYQIDLYRIINSAYIKASKEKPRTLIIGFPIPEISGGIPGQIHWQPIALPSIKLSGGFRAGISQATEIARRLFHDNSSINWLDAQNGSPSAVSSRGRLPQSLRDSKILLIGGGAVGSILSECLMRGSCAHLHILDQEKMEIGNMSRHTLTLTALDQYKAEALGKRLSLIFPGIGVSWSNKSIQSELSFDREYLNKYDLVIDATGNDEALHHISDAISGSNTRFVSISLGMFAKRLFFYNYISKKNIEAEFKTQFRPFLEEELKKSENVSYPREGIGCWHPLFPARADDVFLMAAAGVKLIEDYMTKNAVPVFKVLEQQVNEEGFQGIITIS